MTDCDTLAAEVSRLGRRVFALEQAVNQLSRRRLASILADADREWLAHLLPAVVAATGGVWVLQDLAALALLPGNESLASAIARPGGFLSMGKALARCAGHIVNGFELRRAGESRDGVVWQVMIRDDYHHTADCAPAALRP